jgi:tRNA(Ile)-lysidine synthase
MSERGSGRLIRPMLALGVDDISNYVRDLELAFVEDTSNASPKFLRNRIRNELIPMLERDYAPSLGNRLIELAGEMRSLDELANEIAARELDMMRVSDDAIDVTRFAGLNRAVQAAVIRRFVGERLGDLRRVGRVHIDDVIRLATQGGPSDSIDLPRGWRACRVYNVLRLTDIELKASLDYSVPLSFDGLTTVEVAGFMFDSSTIGIADAQLPPRSNVSVAMFDLDADGMRESGLVVRNFIAGDRIHPLEMRGDKKVKSVFIDRKIPRGNRRAYPIITLDNEVVWIPGLVRGCRASIVSSTETVLRVEASRTIA